MGEFAAIGSSILLFFLVFGMSATVDITHLKKQLRNRNALLTGISLQFIILPFLGFCVVKLLRMGAPMGISLLVVTSSPGGSYSNWWCSMFNADLALSVTMTAISTLLSVVMLPVNLIIYATTSYSSAVVKSLDWGALFHSLITVIGAITAGLVCSATIQSHKFNLWANKGGNLAGIALVTYSIVVSSSDHNAQIWDKDWVFYLGIALPCVLGLIIATCMAIYFRLDKPERVSVAVECCYQNTGIATSVAINMFQGANLATAVGVPLFYGICEAVLLALYCLGAWKAGWTKAPRDENVCVVIATSYEVQESVMQDPEAIEVVLGSPSLKDGGPPSDLIFATTSEGYQIDEDSLESLQAMEEGDETSTLASTEELKLEDTIDSHEQQQQQQQQDDGGDDDDGEKEESTDEEALPEVSRDTKNAMRRRGRQYSSIECTSPETDRMTGISSPPRKLSVPPLGGGDKDAQSISSSGGSNRLGRAAATIRSRVAGKRYTKAVSDVAEDSYVEGDDEDEQNFNFPSLSATPSRETVSGSGEEPPIPAEDKTID